MSEAYQQKEWELDSLIDNLNSIEYTYEEYKKEVEYFIDRLLEDTKEINTLKKEIERLNNIISKAIIFLKSIGYDEEIGRIWNDMNDDECTDLLKILEGGKE